MEKSMTVLFNVTVGSRAYNLVTPESDYDSRRVVTPDTLDFFFGLNAFKTTVLTKEGNTDSTDYSVKDFIQMVINCNTVMMEMLYAPEDMIQYMHPLFKKYFYLNRSKFLTKRIYKAISSYADAEYRRSLGLTTRNLGAERKLDIEKYGYSIKNASHCIRLLNAGGVALRTKTFPVWLEGEMRDFIYRLKLGYIDKQEYLAVYKLLMTYLDDANRESTLPEEPNYELYNQFLTDFYLDFFGIESSAIAKYKSKKEL